MARRILLLLASAGLFAALCPAQEQGVDYFSVKKAKVLVREEPDPKAKVLWPLWRFAPVEAVSYRGDWVRVRDFEGDAGWVKKSELTSDVPTVQVKAKEGRIRKGPGEKQKIIWLLDRGFALRVFGAKGDWLDVGDLDAVSGWIHSDEVWGFPPPKNPSSEQ
ncbi:MAG: hypothetical protein HY922_02375 [Elusimicrobia bacterium]|nr:hypothetical protein [Elusimicrobiota bacterium]